MKTLKNKNLYTLCKPTKYISIKPIQQKVIVRIGLI